MVNLGLIAVLAIAGLVKSTPGPVSLGSDLSILVHNDLYGTSGHLPSFSRLCFADDVIYRCQFHSITISHYRLDTCIFIFCLVIVHSTR
jgi:hypothetical protein